MSRMAQIDINLDCGGFIRTYIKCKDEAELLKKLNKVYKDGKGDFGHFKVNDKSVISASFILHRVQ